jgi:choline-sulfatase
MADRPPFLNWWHRETGADRATSADVLRSRAAYWGLVTALDALIGRILDTLEETGLSKDTLVVYTSDHGDMVGEHGLFWKHVFYEDSVKVPLLMSWPGVIPAGHVDSRVVSSLDVTATLLDALQCPALPGSPGRSILPLPNQEDWEDVAFSEYCSDEYAPEGGCYHRMIRQGRWKLIYYHGEPSQLFDLSEDPDEQHDLRRNRSCQTIAGDLEARLLADWDPEQVRRRMAGLLAQTAVLEKWARRTNPEESHRWPLTGAMNFLDDGDDGSSAS